jgi:hypothetical protein
MEIFMEDESHGAGATLKPIVDEIVKRESLVLHSHPDIVAIVRFDSNHPPIFHVGLDHTGTGAPTVTNTGRINGLNGARRHGEPQLDLDLSSKE